MIYHHLLSLFSLNILFRALNFIAVIKFISQKNKVLHFFGIKVINMLSRFNIIYQWALAVMV